MKTFFYSLIVALCSNASAQQVDLLTNLSVDINETSGLLFINQKIITHNDSGGEPALYEIDSISGNVLRKVVIDNATNVDWEDIAADDNYIYIGDFGNNAGSRTNLKVYRLLQDDFFNTPNDTVLVDMILFSYFDQVDFTPTSYSTNFDAEALIAFNDSLYIFTKNWGNNKTNIYSLPKVPGTYQVERIDSIDTQGLVTGAEVVSANSSVILCGYAGVNPFIFEVKNVSGNQFSSGSLLRSSIAVPSGYSPQIEGITKVNETQFYFSSEEFINGAPAGLYRLTMNELASVYEVDEPVVTVFPNPALNQITIECYSKERLEIINALGEIVQTVQLIPGTNHLQIENLPKGNYILNFSDSKIKEKVVIL